MLEKISTVHKGKVIHDYELEDSDKNVIKELIVGTHGQFDYWEEQFTVELTGDLTGNTVEFDVAIADYLTPEEWVRSLEFNYLLDTLVDKYNELASSSESKAKNKYHLYSYKEGYYQAIKNLNVLSWDNLAGLNEITFIEDFISIKGL